MNASAVTMTMCVLICIMLIKADAFQKFWKNTVYDLKCVAYNMQPNA